MKEIITSADVDRIKDLATPVIRRYHKKGSYEFNSIISHLLVKVYKNLNSYDEEKGSFKTWVKTIAFHCTCDYDKANRRWSEKHTGLTYEKSNGDVYELSDYFSKSFAGNRADSDLVSRENIALIDKAVMSLGERTAQALKLSAEGYSIKEIAKIMGENSESALRARISRGRSVLAEHPDIVSLRSMYIADNCAA